MPVLCMCSHKWSEEVLVCVCRTCDRCHLYFLKKSIDILMLIRCMKTMMYDFCCSGQVRILTNDEDDVDSKESDSDGCEFYGPAQPPQGKNIFNYIII